jgi:hypothetical protein
MWQFAPPSVVVPDTPLLVHQLLILPAHDQLQSPALLWHALSPTSFV